MPSPRSCPPYKIITHCCASNLTIVLHTHPTGVVLRRKEAKGGLCLQAVIYPIHIYTRSSLSSHPFSVHSGPSMDRACFLNSVLACCSTGLTTFLGHVSMPGVLASYNCYPRIHGQAWVGVCVCVEGLGRGTGCGNYTNCQRMPQPITSSPRSKCTYYKTNPFFEKKSTAKICYRAMHMFVCLCSTPWGSCTPRSQPHPEHGIRQN